MITVNSLWFCCLFGIPLYTTVLLASHINLLYCTLKGWLILVLQVYPSPSLKSSPREKKHFLLVNVVGAAALDRITYGNCLKPNTCHYPHRHWPDPTPIYSNAIDVHWSQQHKGSTGTRGVTPDLRCVTGGLDGVQVITWGFSGALGLVLPCPFRPLHLTCPGPGTPLRTELSQDGQNPCCHQNKYSSPKAQRPSELSGHRAARSSAPGSPGVWAGPRGGGGSGTP